MPRVTWQAYCLTCKRGLYASPKGRDVEAVARSHVTSTGHTVLLGYEMDPGFVAAPLLYENGPCDLGVKEAGPTGPTLFDGEENPHA